MSTVTAFPKEDDLAKPSTRSKAEILQLLADGSTDEHLYVELKALNMAIANAKEARKTAVAKLVESMGTHEVTLSELVDAQAFTREDILKEATAYYPQFGKPSRVSKVAAAGASPKAAKTTKATGQELVKIVVPNAKGPRTTIKTDSEKPVAFGSGFEYLKAMKGNLKDNFLSFAVSPEAAAWMKDARQEKWLNGWIGYISRSGKKA